MLSQVVPSTSSNFDGTVIIHDGPFTRFFHIYRGNSEQMSHSYASEPAALIVASSFDDPVPSCSTDRLEIERVQWLSLWSLDPHFA